MTKGCCLFYLAAALRPRRALRERYTLLLASVTPRQKYWCREDMASRKRPAVAEPQQQTFDEMGRVSEAQRQLKAAQVRIGELQEENRELRRRAGVSQESALRRGARAGAPTLRERQIR